MTKSAETSDFVTFTEEILNGKLGFLCSVNVVNKLLHLFCLYSGYDILQDYIRKVQFFSNIIIYDNITNMTLIWNKVFKNGTSKICGRQPLTIWSDMVCLSFQIFKGCLPQILLVPFLNTLWNIFLLRIYSCTLSIKKLCLLQNFDFSNVTKPLLNVFFVSY